MHDVVVRAVRKAVSAATIIFTATSISRCFVIMLSFLFLTTNYTNYTNFKGIIGALDIIR